MNNHKVIVTGFRARIFASWKLAGLLADAVHRANVLEFLLFGEVTTVLRLDPHAFQLCVRDEWIVGYALLLPH